MPDPDQGFHHGHTRLLKRDQNLRRPALYRLLQPLHKQVYTTGKPPQKVPAGSTCKKLTELFKAALTELFKAA